MKLSTIVPLALCAALVTPAVKAEGPTPDPTGNGLGQNQNEANATEERKGNGGGGGTPQIERVPPGESGSNEDGVEVENTGDGSSDEDGDITINPSTGNANSATTVTFENDAHGTVSGIDSNDTVDVAHGADATISATGGTVDLTAGGSSGRITNMANPGGPSITILVPGDTFGLSPGSSMTF